MPLRYIALKGLPHNEKLSCRTGSTEKAYYARKRRQKIKRPIAALALPVSLSDGLCLITLSDISQTFYFAHQTRNHIAYIITQRAITLIAIKNTAAIFKSLGVPILIPSLLKLIHFATSLPAPSR